MGHILKELVKKYGVGMVMGAITMDGYRRQVANDRTNNLWERIQAEAKETAAEQKKNKRRLSKRHSRANGKS